MNRIDALFANARRAKRTVFIPFVTAGDPDLPTTVAVAKALIEAGGQIGVPILLEIGFPYSDPIADGATIQASYTRALDRGVRVAEILSAVKALRRETETPLVAMISYSLVFKHSGAEFLSRLQEAGVDGAIVPDLPVEEADALCARAQSIDFRIIQLIAPTTVDGRATRILSHSSGFVYYISVTGITGERTTLPEDLPVRVASLRQKTELPICVGFGISRPEQVASLRDVADGVIVGSAIVRRLADLPRTGSAGVNDLAKLVTTLMQPLAKT